MVDIYKPESLDERKSQNLGPVDYIKHRLFLSIPILGATAGYTLGRIGKNKLPVFDGTPAFINKLMEGGMKKGASKVLGTSKKLVLNETDRLPWIANLHDSPEDQVAAVRSAWNTIKGFEVSAIPFAFFLWKKKEGQGVDLVEAYENLHHSDVFCKTKQDLELEKRSLVKQMDFIDRKSQDAPTMTASSISLEGNLVAEHNQDKHR